MQPLLQQSMDARIDDLRLDQRAKEGYRIPQDWSKLATSPTPPTNSERRSGPRTPSRQSLFVLTSGGRSVQGETLDAGPNGFACRIQEPFGIGEKLPCIISLTSGRPLTQAPEKFLDCSIEVVRTALNKDGFIVAVRIHESKTIGPEEVPDWAASLTAHLSTIPA
jgi:hypothetical protein